MSVYAGKSHTSKDMKSVAVNLMRKSSMSHINSVQYENLISAHSTSLVDSKGLLNMNDLQPKSLQSGQKQKIRLSTLISAPKIGAARDKKYVYKRQLKDEVQFNSKYISEFFIHKHLFLLIVTFFLSHYKCIWQSY